MTTRETELERQLSHIVKECEASSTQSKRIQRIKARAEAAINGSDPDFKSVGDRRDDKIAHIGRLNMMNAQLQVTLAASQAREQQLRRQILLMIDSWWPFVHGSFPSDTARNMFRKASDSIQPPYDTTALNELIEKVERRTIERCAKKLLSIGALGDGDFLAAIRALPTGQIKLEELK